MARGRDRRAAIHRVLLPRVVPIGQLALALIAIAAIVIVRSGPAASAQRTIDLAAISQLTPAQLKTAAADKLEALTAKGGRGFRFEIVQGSRMQAKAGGPQVPIPDPSDPYKSVGVADHYDLGGLIEAGFVVPDGFWMEMRSGPSAGAAPDFANAELQMSALVKGGITWRNDGDGWYETDSPPGIGLDPRTAALLPALLRNATTPKDDGIRILAGKTVRSVSSDAATKDIPGVIAVDGEPFTKLLAPIEFAFDGTGQLAQMRVVAQNENLKEFDLVVTTTISFDYETAIPALPEPSPAFIPPTAAPGN